MTQTFVPPSPGAWELERSHLTRPISVLAASVFPPNMIKGFADGSRHYGVLLDYMDIAVIHRFVYMAPRPAGAPKSAKGVPPKFMFKLLTRLHPELRRRIKRSAQVFEERIWRDDVAKWHNEVKPAIAAEALALLADDIASLPTPQFVDHLRGAVAFWGRTMYWHHRYNMTAMIPTGDFIAQTMAWTGLSAEEILCALRGSSPASAGATAELSALRTAVLADPASLTLLRSNADPVAILAGLRARPAPAGPAVAAYLDLVGMRLVGGYDVTDEQAFEHPDMLLNIIRAAVMQDEAAGRVDPHQAIARVRDRVPADRRGAFDELLREAQMTYQVRDERIFYGDSLGAGVARRAMLEAGARLHRDGRVLAPVHVMEATVDESAGLLEGGAAPSASELAERFRYRIETSIDTAPGRLGFPPSAPPPVEWLPPAAARLQRAVTILLELMFQAREGQTSRKTFKGFSASPGTYEGRARVITSIGQLPLVQEGEVLVTRSTGPMFNVVLPLIRALVTDRGGALSHAAIVAREYGIPAVVGCGSASAAMTTGMRVRVDGDAGEVTVLD